LRHCCAASLLASRKNMQVEGKGLIAPAPEKVYLERMELEYLKSIAEAREKRRGYSRRNDSWGRGVIDNPTLMGLCGEYALASWLTERLGIPVRLDESDTPLGDGGTDFLIAAQRVQVKTRRRRGDSLLRRMNERGTLCPINWNFFVTATYNREADESLVTLDGVTKADRWRNDGSFVVGRAGPWMNLELQDFQMEPMTRLVEALEVARLMRETT
jgi:hypothetical protein